LSAILLFLYQAWPWQRAQFTDGFWSAFPWLVTLGWIPVHVELPANVFGVLFLIPIVYGSVTLSWPGGLLAWLLSLTWVLPELATWSVRREPVNLLVLFVPVLLAAVVFGERRWRESERRYYAERERERKAYVAKLVESQEAERRRIALEIHDDTLQTLLAIANKLDSVASAPLAPEQSKGILWAKERLSQSMEDLRRMSMNLRPSVLDNFGLVAGVRWLVDNTGQGRCHITTLVKGEPQKMSSLAEVTVFRVVQESLSNIHRHSQAEHASITLEFDHHHLELDIQDDGIGFAQPERFSAYAERNKLGLIGMEQRILAIGGTLDLQSSPGIGTHLHAIIPYMVSDELVQVDESHL
jgi:signal transduction histidine kinase